jgi:adenylosuccinate synthase
VQYETLQGWKSDISQVRQFDNLPENAKRYVRRIEELVGVKVKWVGVGPARDAMVEV